MKPAILSLAASLLFAVPVLAGCAGEEAEAGEAAYPPVGYTPPADVPAAQAPAAAARAASRRASDLPSEQADARSRARPVRRLAVGFPTGRRGR